MTRLASGIVALLLTTSLGAQAGTGLAQTDAEWLGQARQRAYDALMPLDVLRLRAGYRTDGDIRLDEIEQYFAISRAKAPSEQLEATVVIPVGGSIARQMLNWHLRDRSASFETVLVQVSVRRFRVDSAECPAIRSRMTALSNLSFTLRDDGLLQADPTMHRIAVWLSAGEFSAKIYPDDHPLVRWGGETHAALMSCGRTSALVR